MKQKQLIDLTIFPRPAKQLMGQMIAESQLESQPESGTEVIAYTIPEKPGSRLQQYRLTKRGKDRLARLERV